MLNTLSFFCWQTALIVAAPTFLVCLYRGSLKWCCRIAAYSLWMNKDTNLPKKTIRKDSVMGNYRMEHLLCRRNLTFGVNSDTRIKILSISSADRWYCRRMIAGMFAHWGLILKYRHAFSCGVKKFPFTRKRVHSRSQGCGLSIQFNKQRTLLC